jgi:glycerol-3-phosphate dehydrogenase subunit B
MTRVVVVGAGLAGLAAGLRLAQGGASVSVISAGNGGLRLSHGTVDVLGYAPDRVDDVGGAVARLAAERPAHPYARLAPGLLAGALAWFREQIEALEPEGDGDRNLLLPTAVGVARPTAIAPASIAAGRLDRPARVAVVGLRALRDFFPSLLADNLRRADTPHPVEARALEIGWSGRPGWADSQAPVHARALDDPAQRAALADELRPLIEPGETVLLPAVVGLRDGAAAWRDLQERLGAPVAEVPTIPPCVPGIRMEAVLLGRLRAAGGDVVLGPSAVGVEGAGGRVRAVLVQQAARTRALPADAVVLATGGFASRGIDIDSHGRLRETVAGLPVAGPPAGEPPLSPRAMDPQPLMRAGLVVDDRMRPVDPGGAPVWANLHAAGALVAGAEPWREKSGEGVALAGAFAAARAILEET